MSKPQGNPGPSQAYTTHSLGGTAVGTTATTLASLSLPAGSYLLIGRNSLQGTANIVRCNFSPAGDSNEDTVNTTVTGSEIESVVSDTMTLTSTTSVSLQCHAASSATAHSIVLEAIKVGGVASQ